MTPISSDADRTCMDRYEQVLDRNLKRERGAAASHIENGRIIEDVRRRSLHRQRGFDTFLDWLWARHRIKKRQADNYRAVRDFPVQLVIDRCISLTDLVAIAPRKYQPLWPALAAIVDGGRSEHFQDALRAGVLVLRGTRDEKLACAEVLRVAEQGRGAPVRDRDRLSPSELGRQGTQKLRALGKIIAELEERKGEGEEFAGAWTETLWQAALGQIEALGRVLGKCSPLQIAGSLNDGSHLGAKNLNRTMAEVAGTYLTEEEEQQLGEHLCHLLQHQPLGAAEPFLRWLHVLCLCRDETDQPVLSSGVFERWLAAMLDPDADRRWRHTLEFFTLGRFKGFPVHLQELATCNLPEWQRTMIRSSQERSCPDAIENR